MSKVGPPFWVNILSGQWGLFILTCWNLDGSHPRSVVLCLASWSLANYMLSQGHKGPHVDFWHTLSV